ncbi:glycosyltransferase [Amycolatopsis regifaucium]|uniref:Glycosyl transferase n=1 Tax=Amycolatopsis regifaucium TaxID=546365 RepID=A0A154M4E3_9PSEU|nr:glycosyltransferase [Amycolatopsis regifaucium]KZB79290.1 hypothetical protein AVL48_17000 [Amycolatopsis regifaucium]OKA07472.1 hypothetical protein ATP06_0216685 [Amycolatopsis regifaucium]SFH10736.1 Glycosyltransferase involved in cell wall bisynthesis [Amycolatopsis regifaucium]
MGDGALSDAEHTGPNGRRRVVYVTHHLPWPVDSGGRLREAQLIARLADRFDIDLVAVSKDLDKDRRGIRQACALGVRPRLFAATQAEGVSGPHALRHDSAPARRHLRHRWRRGAGRAAGTEVVHVEGHYLMSLLPRSARRRAILVEHNIESALLRQAVHAVPPPRPELSVTSADAARTRIDERQAWLTARMVVGVTPEDVSAIAEVVGPARARLVPNGADHVLGADERKFRRDPECASQLVFVGNFAYSPSADAAHELIERILPAVRALAGPASLALVGSGPPRWLYEAAARRGGVTVTGTVADVVPWLRGATVVVAPLRIGGGVKVKVLEALALGKAVVTTGIGAQGLRHLPPGSLVLADEPHEYAVAVARLLTDDSERERQESRARLAARRLPTWDSAAERLAACWSEG